MRIWAWVFLLAVAVIDCGGGEEGEDGGAVYHNQVRDLAQFSFLVFEI